VVKFLSRFRYLEGFLFEVCLRLCGGCVAKSFFRCLLGSGVGGRLECSVPFFFVCV